jgi:hypothetical protein
MASSAARPAGHRFTHGHVPHAVEGLGGYEAVSSGAAYDGLTPTNVPAPRGIAGATERPASRRKREGWPEGHVAPETPHPCHGEDEVLAGSRHAHVAQAPLLRERLRGGVAIVGHQAVLGATMATVSELRAATAPNAAASLAARLFGVSARCSGPSRMLLPRRLAQRSPRAGPTVPGGADDQSV